MKQLLAIVLVVAVHLNSTCDDYKGFGIRGKNPTEPEAEAYIAGLNGCMWYWKYVAMWESDQSSQGRYYAQFNEVGSYECSVSDVRYTPNSSNNGDGGFGIFQLTNPVPNSLMLWNWKENINAGTALLNIRQAQANSWMDGQRTQSGGVPVPDRTEGNVTFRDNSSRLIEHAVALKMYNGASNGNYCYWNNSIQPARWDWNPLNNLGVNYVNNVCSLVQ